MSQKPPYELTVLAMGDGGDAVVQLGGRRAFVARALPNEHILANGGGERLSLERVLVQSPDRTIPPCRHFGECGGCALQHWKSHPYLEWKRSLIANALSRVGMETEIMPIWAAPEGSRRRIALHARRHGSSVVLGFKARRSWSVVPIEECRVADPRLVDAVPGLKPLAALLFQNPKSAPTLHLTLALNGIDVDVTGVSGVERMSADRRLQVSEAAASAGLIRLTLSGETYYQSEPPLVRFGSALVPLPPGGFLQAVQGAEVELARLAKEALSGAKRVADLFCGAGAFTFPLAEKAHVFAYDSSPAAITALQQGRANAAGLMPIDAAARDLFRRPLLAPELSKLDAALFDPPRAGAEAQIAEIAASKLSLVVGVSCNPVTFARDAAILVAAGFRLQSVHPVDQFLWSSHVELVGVFRR